MEGNETSVLILIDTDSKVTSSLDEGNSEDMAERRGAERESGPGEKINLTEFFNSRQNGARKTWNEGVGELGFAGLDEVIADEAIEKLEKLTGNEFVIDSAKTQYDKPSSKEIEDEKERLNNGYYSEDKLS